MYRPRLGIWLVAITMIGACEPSGGTLVVGSGNRITVTPQVEAFDKVALVGGFRVAVALGQAPSLAITTDDNLIPLIETKVEGGTLHVRRPNNLEPSDGVTLKIVTPTLARFAVDGAVRGEIRDVAGSALAVVVNGAGKLTVTGAVDDLTLEVHGAGGIDAWDLDATTVDVSLEGAGRIQTHAIRQLNITVEGLGVVEYRGDPEVTKSASALARIIKMD